MPTPSDELAAAVKAHDRDRYIAILFASEQARPTLWALFAFAAELARIPASVTESGLGEIRLEWWRGAIDELEAGHNPGHPVAETLSPFVASGIIDADRLRAMIDGRTPDLYSDPLPDMAALEAYFGATRSLPIRAAIDVLSPGIDMTEAADAAGHGGVALGLTQILVHLSETVARRAELFPADVLERHGVVPAALTETSRGTGAKAVLNELVGAARNHLFKAKAAGRSLPAATLPALLPLAPLARDLARAERAARNDRELSGGGPMAHQFAMWRAMRRGRLD